MFWSFCCLVWWEEVEKGGGGGGWGQGGVLAGNKINLWFLLLFSNTFNKEIYLIILFPRAMDFKR